MQRLITVIGPTAVGKTKVSIDLALKLNTEIISGDSMLVYKRMNIGTAKPTEAEKKGVPHHLIDIIEPDAEYSVVDFQKQAAELISVLSKQECIPIIAGGTGLYVKALLEGYRFIDTPADEGLRLSLTRMAEEHGPEYLYQQLQKADSRAAGRLHPRDIRRVIRALEICLSPNASASTDMSTAKTGWQYEAVVIGLSMERSLLYDRINQRVNCMLENGLINEVKELLEAGIPATSQSMQGIGYKEVVAYLNRETDLVTTVEKIKQNTRNFAKRQLTWYRKMPYIRWFDATVPYEELMESIYSHIAENFQLR